jgi:phospholipid/cholesterol/gamma-HCH transport system substrate-binding protein
MAVGRNIKVGIFVFTGMLIVFVLIFLIGQERNMFAKKGEYRTVFQDVEGLRRGSTVRMGGVDVGGVTGVAYSDNPRDDRIYVTFEVVLSESRRVRQDSVATIEGKGLLGDKMIVLSVGSPDKPPVPQGGTVRSESGNDITKALENVANITVKAEQVLENLNRTTSAFADHRFTEDVREGVHSLSSILQRVDSGEGYVGRLMRDPAEADRISHVIANLERSTARLDQTLAGVNSVVARVQSGPGLAHDVIYQDGPSKAIEQFGGAADELRLTLKGIREGNGLAHSVIYGDESSGEMMSNINDMTSDLKQIVADVRAGKGTIGALLVDPSVYEDLKLLLGNVERNKTLRALVRYSITRDERRPSVEVRDPSAAPPPRPPGTAAAGDSVPVGKSGSATSTDSFRTP